MDILTDCITQPLPPFQIKYTSVYTLYIYGSSLRFKMATTQKKRQAKLLCDRALRNGLFTCIRSESRNINGLLHVWTTFVKLMVIYTEIRIRSVVR